MQYVKASDLNESHHGQWIEMDDDTGTRGPIARVTHIPELPAGAGGPEGRAGVLLAFHVRGGDRLIERFLQVDEEVIILDYPSEHPGTNLLNRGL